MSKQLKGSLMVITAGIAWGVSGVSGQYLMAHGVNVNLLTSLRLLLSGILLTASVTTLMGEQPNPWDLLQPQDVTSRHRGAKPPRRYLSRTQDIVQF